MAAPATDGPPSGLSLARAPRGPTAGGLSLTYALPTTAGTSQVIPGQLAAIFRGPGMITQVKLVSTSAVDVGFYVVGYIGGVGATLLSPATPNVNTMWNGQGGAGSGVITYSIPAVYAVQEVINNGNGGIQFGPGVVNNLPTMADNFSSITFTTGQQFSFQNSFANGYLSIGGLVNTTPNYGNVAQIGYTLFAPLPFVDEVRVYLTPFTLWANQNNGGNHYAPNPASINITVNATLG